ncbi:MAG: hypothetical protein KA368_23565 [Acidobacteria bacterium]|nr:hypothetical protein [Acidobacteriota bacterium]
MYLPQYLTTRAVNRIFARQPTGVPVNTMTHSVLRSEVQKKSFVELITDGTY